MKKLGTDIVEYGKSRKKSPLNHFSKQMSLSGGQTG
jgi:hypothetical protein